MKLTIELVPESCFFKNVRSNVSPADWEILRKDTLQKAGHKCEVCGFTGLLHCHEVWDYNDQTHEQKLARLQALCPACHEVKHFGLAGVKGRRTFALRHFALLNELSRSEAEGHVYKAFEQWAERSKHQWKLDISFLKNRGIGLEPQPERS